MGSYLSCWRWWWGAIWKICSYSRCVFALVQFERGWCYCRGGQRMLSSVMDCQRWARLTVDSGLTDRGQNNHGSGSRSRWEDQLRGVYQDGWEYGCFHEYDFRYASPFPKLSTPLAIGIVTRTWPSAMIWQRHDRLSYWLSNRSVLVNTPQQIPAQLASGMSYLDTEHDCWCITTSSEYHDGDLNYISLGRSVL